LFVEKKISRSVGSPRPLWRKAGAACLVHRSINDIRGRLFLPWSLPADGTPRSAVLEPLVGTRRARVFALIATLRSPKKRSRKKEGGLFGRRPIFVGRTNSGEVGPGRASMWPIFVFRGAAAAVRRWAAPPRGAPKHFFERASSRAGLSSACFFSGFITCRPSHEPPAGGRTKRGDAGNGAVGARQGRFAGAVQLAQELECRSRSIAKRKAAVGPGRVYDGVTPTANGWSSKLRRLKEAGICAHPSCRKWGS